MTDARQEWAAIRQRQAADRAAVPAEAIAAAAAWWAARLGTVPESPGYPAPCRYSAEETERFRVALEAAIGAHLRGEVPDLEAHPRRAAGYDNHENVVFFDYDPDDTLCAAAEAAGITLDWTSLFRKTTMTLYSGEVVVSDGYAAPREAIWSAAAEGSPS